MGVAGCGKSTVGAALAAAEKLPLVEGDDFHSAGHNTINSTKAAKPATGDSLPATEYNTNISTRSK